jgi:hypothetical protein
MVSTKVCRFFECLSNSLPRHRRQQMSRQNAEHVRLEIRSNEIDNEFAGWERPFAEQEGEPGQMLGFYSPKSSLRMIAVICAWRFSHHSQDVEAAGSADRKAYAV